ncbi:MAG: RIP metalloprotease RseP [Alphaproteobacteria bacterium]
MHIILDSFHNIISFLVIISVIVFIHEFGHYIAAKSFGVKINIFSIGFGKELVGWNDKSGTRWKICAIPMGGYVKMHGDENAASMPDEELLSNLTEAEKKDSFHAKPLYAKALVVSAGPIANFILAIVLLTFIFNVYGKAVVLPIIDQIQENSSAQKAGLNIGDEIISINNNPIKVFSDIERIIFENPNQALNFEIKRADSILHIPIIPHLTETKDSFGNKITVPRVGIISRKFEIQKFSVINSLMMATKETYMLSKATINAIGQMITGKRGTEELGGPISIAKYSGQSVKSGFITVLWFIILLSINLGLINLMPIPILDGGHLLFYAIEAIKGSPLSQRIQQYSFRIGLVIVLSLMAFSTFNDIKKLFIN